MPITSETSFGTIPPAAPETCSLSATQYQVNAVGSGPCGGIVVDIGAQSDQAINLYARRGQRVAIVGGQVIADMATTAPKSSQGFVLTTSGSYYIAVGNCSTATANFAISTQHIAVDPPFPAIVNGCALVREPNGRFVLELYGSNMKEGATVTVGGIAPKKVKFVALEAGSTTSYKLVRLAKRFCGGLPGNIVFTNPGPCNNSLPFFCNERCPD